MVGNENKFRGEGILTFDHLRDIINTFKICCPGVPAVAQPDGQHLGSTGTQVRSPAWNSGLRIPECSSGGLGHSCGSDLIPGPETHICHRVAKKGEKNSVAQIGGFIYKEPFASVKVSESLLAAKGSQETLPTCMHGDQIPTRRRPARYPPLQSPSSP